jgi:oxygen-independent coproporphyrinogen-3 oxidase
MMALPNYNKAEFDETLALLHDEEAVHISAYLLKIEKGTPFGSTPPEHLPSAEEAADFYLYAVGQLAAAGYAQYEISNFAKPGFESRHNLIYWNCEDYLGLGPAAHSCMGNRRFSFAADTAAFIDGAARTQPEGDCTAEDYVMLRLRLNEGMQEAEMERRWGVQSGKKQYDFLQALTKQGFARAVPGGWALTPQGMLVQNSILVQLLE